MHYYIDYSGKKLEYMHQQHTGTGKAGRLKM